MSRRFETLARITAEHSDEQLCAHVELPDDIEIGPGDRVRVHGAAIALKFGERRTFERVATVERANRFERAWAKLEGQFQLTELFEVSFTGGSLR